MTSAVSWQNSICLCPASFHIPRPNLPVTPGVSWLPTFAFQSPIMKRTSFLMLVLKCLVGLHRTVQLQLLQHHWLGHRLGLLCYWMVCLGNEQRSFCRFWDCIQVLHFGLSLVDYDDYSIDPSEEVWLPSPGSQGPFMSGLCWHLQCHFPSFHCPHALPQIPILTIFICWAPEYACSLSHLSL